MALDIPLQLLSAHLVFAVLEREALRMLAFAAERKDLSAGNILFDQGEAADAAYLILEGQVSMTSVRAGQTKRRETAQAGALLGESALITPTQHAATVRAETATTLLRLPRSAYRRILEEFPRSAVDLRQKLAERLLATVGDLDTVRQSLED